MIKDSAIWSRRTLLKSAITITGLGAAGTFVSNGVPQTSSRPAQNTGSILILLGTQGGPGVSLERGESSSVLVIDGQPYLIDCGYGTLRALVQAGLNFNDLANVLSRCRRKWQLLQRKPLRKMRRASSVISWKPTQVLK